MGGAFARAVAVTALIFACASSARADEKTMCSDKYQSAQRFRAGGKLTLARADLLRCAEQACPAFVSNDCKTWLAQVEADLPTLVFAVLDPDGHDIPNAFVRVDGAGVANATDGLGHAVDPGEHVVEAMAKGQWLRLHVVVRVGEKSRRIELRIAPASSPPSAAPALPAQTAEQSVESSGAPAGAYVLGGIGLLGIGVGSVLWVTGSNAAQTYNAECQTTGCTASQRENARAQLIAGDVSWGVGLGAGILALAVVLVHHGGRGATTVSLGPNGVIVGGRF